VPDLGQRRQVAQLSAPSSCGVQVADTDAGCGGDQERVDQLLNGAWGDGRGVEQVDAATCVAAAAKVSSARRWAPVNA
jgi:hypothetical protein